MRYISFLLFLFLVCESPYNSFCLSFADKYKRDEKRIRKVFPSLPKSMLYVPKIMNTVGDKEFDNMGIPQKRKDLFFMLASKKLYLCYPEAIDTIDGSYYHRPNAELDYYHRSIVADNLFIKLDDSHSQKNTHDMIDSLISYVKTHKIDYIFTIANIVDTDSPRMYWVISGCDLYVIRYSPEEKCFIEISADYYLQNVADDAVFDIGKRLLCL